MRVLCFLSLRYWRRRFVRGSTTVFGVVLGVALVVSVGMINRSILATYVRLTEALAGRAQLEVRSLSDQGMDASWRESVRKLDGVAVATPLLERRSFLFFRDRNVPLLLRGIDPRSDVAVRSLELTAGRALLPEDAAAIVLADPLASSLGIEVGDSVELLTPEGFSEFRVVGVFVGIDPLSAPQSRIAVVPIRALQALYLQGRSIVGQLDVMLMPDARVEEVSERIQRLLEGTAFVQRPLEKAKKIAELTRGVRFMLLLASVMSLVAAAYLIANNVLAAVHERQEDLAVVRSLGLSRFAVRGWLLGEVLVLGGSGSLLGTGVGALAASLLARVVSGRLLAPFEFGIDRLDPAPPVLLAGFSIGVITSLLAAYPAIALVARGPAAASFRSRFYGYSQRKGWVERLFSWLPVVGLIASGAIGLLLHTSREFSRAGSLLSLLLVLLVMVGVATALPVLLANLGSSLQGWSASPLWLRLAADSLRRHRRRTGAVAASLMITLAILVGVFGMVRSYRGSIAVWMNEMFGWDLMVSSRTQGLRAAVPLNEALGRELEKVPGVQAASPERFVIAGLGSSAVNLYAFDMGDFPVMRRFSSVAGEPGTSLPGVLRGHRRVAVSTTLAPLFDLHVGDVVTLTTPNGPRGYVIAAIVQDPGAATGALYMDRSVYVTDFRDPVVDSFALLLEPDADQHRVAALLADRFSGRYDLQVVSAATFKSDVSRMVTETFGLSQVLVLTAVLVALFGLMNAGMIGVWQLRRQLAVLRALGAPVGLLSRTLLAEAWLTSALSGVVGVLVGTLLSTVLLKTVQASSTLVVTWSWPYGAYALVGGIALLGSLAAAYPPAREAGRVVPAEALRLR